MAHDGLNYQRARYTKRLEPRYGLALSWTAGM